MERNKLWAKLDEEARKEFEAIEPLIKLSNYLQQHQNGIDMRWVARVIDEASCTIRSAGKRAEQAESQLSRLTARLKVPKIHKHVDDQPRPVCCEECDSTC